MLSLALFHCHRPTPPPRPACRRAIALGLRGLWWCCSRASLGGTLSPRRFLPCLAFVFHGPNLRLLIRRGLQPLLLALIPHRQALSLIRQYASGRRAHGPPRTRRRCVPICPLAIRFAGTNALPGDLDGIHQGKRDHPPSGAAPAGRRSSGARSGHGAVKGDWTSYTVLPVEAGRRSCSARRGAGCLPLQ